MGMSWKERRALWKNHGTMRPCLMGLGWFLIVLSPIVGALPGPGGIFVFAAGVALLLETSTKAKRAYVRIKRRWPKVGEWTDWGLRRQSWKRRQERVATASAR
jgi:hypothetical protein